MRNMVRQITAAPCVAVEAPSILSGSLDSSMAATRLVGSKIDQEMKRRLSFYMRFAIIENFIENVKKYPVSEKREN